MNIIKRNHQSKSNSLKKFKRKYKNAITLRYLEQCLRKEKNTPSDPYDRTSDERYGRITMLEELIKKAKKERF